MKRVLFILVAGLMTITGCYKEKPIHAPLLPNKYDVSDNPSDSIQHFKHMFYKKYKTYFLTNPTISDYRFNFKDKNNIDIIPLKQNPRIVQKGIDLFNVLQINIQRTSKMQIYPILSLLPIRFLF